MNARDEVWPRIRGLYGIADAEASAGDPVRSGMQLLEGGCRLVQLRCKGWSDDDLRAAALELVRRCRAVGATFIVNDRAQIAVDVDAHGVHVGQLDASTDAVRAVLGSGRILGRSTNDVRQVASALDGADYLAFGPVHATPHLSRPKAVQGLRALAQVRAQCPLPLVAIGGITAATLPAVRATGVEAWAVIGAVARSADPVSATRGLLG